MVSVSWVCKILKQGLILIVLVIILLLAGYNMKRLDRLVKYYHLGEYRREVTVVYYYCLQYNTADALQRQSDHTWRILIALISGLEFLNIRTVHLIPFKGKLFKSSMIRVLWMGWSRWSNGPSIDPTIPTHSIRIWSTNRMACLLDHFVYSIDSFASSSLKCCSTWLPPWPIYSTPE